MNCKKCGSTYVVNKTHTLCDDCNYIRIHGESRISAVIRKELAKVKTYITPVRKPVKTTKNKVKHTDKLITLDKRKETLKKDRETYKLVFISKPNCCEECGIGLPDFFETLDGSIADISQYSHILSKGAWPQFRHNPENFNRLCPIHHSQWETGDRKSMKIYEGNMKIIDKLLNE